MKKFFCLIVFVIFINSFASSEDAVNLNISKLNNLYLNGVLNKDSYIISLSKLGLDTKNDIFSNLFDLFENNTIDRKSYENSILNLINIGSVSIKTKNNNQIISFQFNIDRCSGDTTVCYIFKEIGIIEIEIFENKLKFSENYKKKLKSHPVIISVDKENFKLNGQDAKLSVIFSTVYGDIVRLEAVGLFENEIFLASYLYAYESGRIILNGSLKPN